DYKKIAGVHTIGFHHSSYNHNAKDVRVFLVEGKYWLFPAKGLSFGGNTKIENAPSEIEMIKKENHYEFNINDIGTYTFNISTENPTNNSNNLLYVIYKAYNPHSSKDIDSFSYTTLDKHKISSDNTDKQYSVVYFTGRMDLIERDQIESLNNLKNKFEKVQFVCMFSEIEDKLIPFKEETNFNWSFIPSVNSKELTKYQIGKLLSEPSIYIVDNNQNKIIYHYNGVYNLPIELMKALNEL
ncbi:MAG: hypothetical protein DSY77_04610, partial [Bacteroidetes bacterium]